MMFLEDNMKEEVYYNGTKYTKHDIVYITDINYFDQTAKDIPFEKLYIMMDLNGNIIVPTFLVKPGYTKTIMDGYLANTHILIEEEVEDNKENDTETENKS